MNRLNAVALAFCGILCSTFVSAENSMTVITTPDSHSCSQFGYITFEDLSEGFNLSAEAIEGVQFTTTGGFTWRVGDFDTGFYNGKYPRGGYTSQGTHWAWLGTQQGTGRLDFPNGPASHFSCLISVNLSPVVLQAFNAQGILLEVAGPTPINYNTGHMAELKIIRPVADMAYVILHDAGNFFLVDSICTDAAGALPPSTPPDVPAPGPTILLGNIDRNLPTIVLTHGLQLQLENQDIEDLEDLWTGTGPKQAATLISDFLIEHDNNDVNIVQYIWRGAFQGRFRQAYVNARSNVPNAATRLAHELFVALGPGYQQPLHFIGHSLGTAVNAYAASAFLNEVPGVTLVQFTALDRPHHISVIPRGPLTPDNLRDNTLFENNYGYDSNFFACVLPVNDLNLTLRIDNYYSLPEFGEVLDGVGDVANGPTRTNLVIYNHQNLVEPNDLDDKGYIVGNEGGSNNHSGVHQWYRWTIIQSNPALFQEESLCAGADFGPNQRPFGFDRSLNPCQQGWYWSLNNHPEAFPDDNADPSGRCTVSPLVLTQSQEFGCDIQPEDPTDGSITMITCPEASSPFAVLQVDIPDDAEYLSFEYRFRSIGDGDYAAVVIDDTPIWVLLGSSVIEEGRFADSGPISIGDFTGSHRLTIVLYGVGEPNAEFELRNIGILSIPENLPPVCDAAGPYTGECQGTSTEVILSGTGSFDPDEDPITYSWTTDCPGGNFDDPTSATPTLTVDTACGSMVNCTVSLTVSDGMASNSCTTMVAISACRPPDCTNAIASIPQLWPPNHMFSLISINGVTDPDGDPVSIEITTITQDEPVKNVGIGSGSTCPDGVLVDSNGDGVPELAGVRSERAGNRMAPGNGRLYVVKFTARDNKGCECDGTVTVCVPHDQSLELTCIEDGQNFNSNVCPDSGGGASVEEERWTPLTLEEFNTLTPEPLFLRGDVQFDENRDITDAVSILSNLFLGGNDLPCKDAADVNDSGEIDISDAIALLSYMFAGGGSLPEPVDGVGVDPSVDHLGCE